MMRFFKEKIESVPKDIWILLAIVLLGIFLRSYHFHGWLDFGSDQVNDATRVGAVVEGKAPWPSYGPDMGNSGTGGRENRFRLGPMYYDFEIISAKIFGNKPDSMAYPDLLFSILSIPLLYYFLRKIFGTNLSLALTGLYAVSFYSLSFSHSAWNVNSIPFFSMLFLFALNEFIVAKEKTHWGWIIALGIALGVGIQLHAILLVLFPATLFFACVFFMRKNPQVWKKLGAVILIMIVLNLGQIISEEQNSFINSKIFWASMTGSSTSSSDSLFVRTANDLSCNFQANTYMLSSIGDGTCDFSLTQFMRGEGTKRILKKIIQPAFIFKAIFCMIFSAIGYGLLVYCYRKEKEIKRKYFFGLIMLYATLSFLVMLPIIGAALRYFVHSIFLPYIFLGFLIDFLMRKFPKKYLLMVASMLILLVASNSFSIYSEVKDEFAQSRIILGEVEAMVDYMISQSGSQKEIYISTTSKTDNFFKSLRYVANEKNISLLRAGDEEKALAEKSEFYLSVGTGSDSTTNTNGSEIDSYKVFNQVTLSHLTN